MAELTHERWGVNWNIFYHVSDMLWALGISGGAFLIPYFLTLIICGIPLVYLETTLGQFASAGCISIFNINPLFKGAGYAVVIVNIIAIIYFAAIMSYPLLYIFHSFTTPLPWQSCGNSWNTERCAEITSNSSSTISGGGLRTPEDEFFHIRLLQMSPSIHEIGGIVWPVLWCNLICWLLVYLCICNGVKSVGKIVYFTVLFPYVVLLALFVRGVTLPGAAQGILYFILPDWSKLKNSKVWADAATQIFYSLGPGWEGSSSIIIPLVNSGTSVWAGFVVFSVLGFAAERAGVPVDKVANAGPGLAFVTYPAAVSMMPAPNFWAVTFFVMLFFLGIDTMFVTIEAVIAGLLDEFPVLRRRRKLITFLTCFSLFLASIICNTKAGLHIIGLLDSHVAIACIPAVCTLEIIAAVYTYGQGKLSTDVLFMTGRPLHRFWLFLWRYILPVILLVVAIYSLREATGIAGWCVALASVICIPIHAAKTIYMSRGPIIERIRENMRANSDWGPAEKEVRLRWESLRRENRDVPLLVMNNRS